MRPLIAVHGETADRVFAEFESMLRQLKEAGKQVFVLLTAPTDPAFDPRLLVSRVTGARIDTPVSVTPWRQEVGAILERVSTAATKAGAVVLDPVPSVCDAGLCAVAGPGGEPTHVDRGHMRPWYVIERATFIDQTLRDPSRKP